MTAVASPPTLTQHNRPAWGMNGHAAGQTLNGQMNPDDVNRMFMPRKNLQRTNSSSSISSNASASTVVGPTPQQPQQQPPQLPQQQPQQPQPPPSQQQPQLAPPSPANGGGGATITAAGDLASWSNAAGTKKRPQGKAPWPSQKIEYASPDMRVMRRDMAPGGGGGPAGGGVLNGIGPMHVPAPVLPSQGQMVASQQVMPRPPMPEGGPSGSQPVLYLLSLNGTFERKTISVPFSPDTLRIGRQTNAKTVPTPINGFFDSKVLSRQHAEIWADRQGKIWIRDVKSSNGTFVNGTRLSQENRESEPHELQTGDHLELGIDIVSEDQKTVVHHKVAAKVEHAGFLNSSSNLLDMNFGDLDPANGSMMMQPVGAMPYRGRNGSQASMANNGRMAAPGNMMAPQPNGMPHQRQGYFFSPISTEQIVKRLQNEMRTARLQSQDLGRTNQFISALLSKDDIRDMEKLDPAENLKSHLSNGNMNSMPFMRSDSKARFTDPPAPPPQQPLPEKPDVPPLKRGTTERPKANTPNSAASPVRQDGNSSQILQLTRDLDQVKRDYEAQSSRMRDLELKLDQERRARELAEELARRLEQDAATAQMNGVATKPADGESTLEAAFEPPVEAPTSSKDQATPSVQAEAEESAPEVSAIETSASHLHTQLESMVKEIRQLKQQLETYKLRAETAEAERDAQRQTLAEMALQIRKDAEAREAAAAKEHKRTRSRSRTLRSSDAGNPIAERPSTPARSPSGRKESHEPAAPADMPSLSRASTITPYSNQAKGLVHDPVVAHSLPYASMLGVVLLGMGLMVYINGWQPQPSRLDK